MLMISRCSTKHKRAYLSHDGPGSSRTLSIPLRMRPAPTKRRQHSVLKSIASTLVLPLLTAVHLASGS